MKGFNKCKWLGHKWGEWKYIPPYQINGEGSFTAEAIDRCIRCRVSRRKTVLTREE